MLEIPPLALSIKQPWSWLIVNGYKDIENRDWPTRRTGPFLIHAGKRFDRGAYEDLCRRYPHIKLPRDDEFQFGGIVGMATITDCVSDHESEWFMGEWGFLLRDAKPLPFVPLRGQLMFFKHGLTAAHFVEANHVG